MSREWLKILNIVSIPIVFILIVVLGLHIIAGLLSLIAVFLFFYFLALFYINIRVPVIDYANSRRDSGTPMDKNGEQQLKTMMILLIMGVLVIGVVCCKLFYPSWILVIYGIMLTLISLLLVFFIEISYKAEYFASKRIRVNYNNAIMAIALLLIFGVFIFITMSSLFAMSTLCFTLILLAVAAYFRTKKTVGFLIYLKHTPVDPASERNRNILSLIAFLIGVGTYIAGSLLIGGAVIIPDVAAMALQLGIVVIITKSIWDIS